MKTFREIRKKTKKVEELLGYATIHGDHSQVDKHLQSDEPEELLGYAAISDKKHRLIDKILGESFTIRKTVKVDDYNKSGNPSPGKVPANKKHASTKSAEFKQNKAAVKHHNGLFKGEDTSHIQDYTHSSRLLNAHLVKQHRLKKDVGVQYRKVTKQLDSQLNHPSNKLKNKVVSYSGVGDKMAEGLSKAKIGTHVHFPAYTSTSIEHERAKYFGKSISHKKSGISGAGLKHSENKGHDEVAHIAVFHLPKGYTKGRHVASVSNHPHENEFTLARNQKFRLKDKRYHHASGTIYHHLEPV